MDSIVVPSIPAAKKHDAKTKVTATNTIRLLLGEGGGNNSRKIGLDMAWSISTDLEETLATCSAQPEFGIQSEHDIHILNRCSAGTFDQIIDGADQ